MKSRDVAIATKLSREGKVTITGLSRLGSQEIVLESWCLSFGFMGAEER